MSNPLSLQNEMAEAAEQALNRDDSLFFLDRLRKRWDKFAYQTPGTVWGLRIFYAVIVFISLYFSIQYGCSDKKSMLHDLLKLMPSLTENVTLFLFISEAVLTLVWLSTPILGIFLCAPIFYICFSAISPISLFAAFFILIFFICEDRPVSMLMLALPPLVLLTPSRLGLGMVIFAAFISTRKNNGVVKTMSFVYFALLELSRGGFGTILSRKGTQIIPAPEDGLSASARMLSYLNYWQADKLHDPLFGKLMVFLGIFFVVGLLFSKLLDMRYSSKQKEALKKLQIDIKDGILFTLLLLFLCSISPILQAFTEFRLTRYDYSSLILSVVVVYLLTRPLAGRSPFREDTLYRDDRHYIFVSYSHADKERILPYLELLHRDGYEFWYDIGIATGTEWQDVIANNLKNCTCFLAFISFNSVVSEYCTKEINYATSKGKPIAAVLLDDILLPPVLEMHLASLQAVQRKQCSNNEECLKKICELEQMNKCKY